MSRAFRAVAVAILKGFVRDRASVFFAIVFPLMFLVLFGGVFSDDDLSRSDLIEIGRVSMIADLPADARSAFDQTFKVTHTEDRDAALAKVRKGDADVAVEMQGKTLVAHYTQTDQVQAAVTQGTLRAFVDGANVAASGRPPEFDFRAERVEDSSLQVIQYVTPGLLGWAVAMSAAFGAAATLQGWRQTKLLRRLQLSPAPTRTIVSARVVVTIGIALVQMAIFLGLGSAAFGLELTGWWWMGIPLLVAGTLCFMALGLFVGRGGAYDGRGDQHGQLPGAPDGLSQWLVLPPGGGTALAADGLARDAAETPQRRHARRTRPRPGAIGSARADGHPDGVRSRDDRCGGPVVQVGPGLNRLVGSRLAFAACH